MYKATASVNQKQAIATAWQRSGRHLHQGGFSLIEFLVASAISMIVLIAAGSTYFTTQQLNRVAGERLNTQQDLRNAANLIVRDARQAGNFGCANLADLNTRVSVKGADEADLTGVLEPLRLRSEFPPDNQPLDPLDERRNRFGINKMAAADFVNAANVANFVPSGDALIFVYGDGYAGIGKINPVAAASGVLASFNISTDKGGPVQQTLDASGVAPLVLSSCKRMQVMRRTTNYTYTAAASQVNVVSPAIPQANFQTGQLALTRLVGSAYVVGSVANTGGQSGLYRFTLAPDGSWIGPQLLVGNLANANGMTIQFGYVNTSSCDDSSPTPSVETFQFYDDTRAFTDHSKLPVLLRIKLDVAGDNRQGVEVGGFQKYVIDASVRGANACVNRMLGS